MFVNSEVFGVHEWVKDVCRRLAKAGYVALAPDLFVRAGDPSKTTDMKVVMDIVKAQPDAQVTSDTAAFPQLPRRPTSCTHDTPGGHWLLLGWWRDVVSAA